MPANTPGRVQPSRFASRAKGTRSPFVSSALETPIPYSERNKIFDRFYRGADGRRVVPGSGLGLFVARKIALALGGSLDLVSDPVASQGTAFRLALPVPESELERIGTAV